MVSNETRCTESPQGEGPTRSMHTFRTVGWCTPSTHVDVAEELNPVRQENVLDANIHARGQDGFDDVGCQTRKASCQKQVRRTSGRDARRTRSCGEPPQERCALDGVGHSGRSRPVCSVLPESSGDEECSTLCEDLSEMR